MKYVSVDPGFLDGIAIILADGTEMPFTEAGSIINRKPADEEER